MLEPNQSLRTLRSPVNNNWNYVYDLIDDSTTDSTWWDVYDLISLPIEDVTRFQLQLPTMRSIKKNLKNVRT